VTPVHYLTSTVDLISLPHPSGSRVSVPPGAPKYPKAQYTFDISSHAVAANLLRERLLGPKFLQRGQLLQNLLLDDNGSDVIGAKTVYSENDGLFCIILYINVWSLMKTC